MSSFRGPPRLLRRLFSSSAHSSSTVLDQLQTRGLLDRVTSLSAHKHLLAPTTVYCGVDPTAPSLHIGNLIPLFALFYFQLYGHRPIALLGGATASIGDPSGKTKTSRAELHRDEVVTNTNKIKSQIESLFQKLLPHARSRLDINISPYMQPLTVMNNLEWTQSLSALDFLRDIGRFVRVPSMISRESVKKRLQGGSGISYAEFSYQLLQARDWEHLYHNEGCSVQIGGSDQTGNIMTGIELYLRKKNIQSLNDSGDDGMYGVTVPLFTTAQGVKFGKSEGNALFVDPLLTSPYELYQYFLRLDDISVHKYLRALTFLPLRVLQEETQKHELAKNQRCAQNLLAGEFTELIHGKDGLENAIKGTKIMYHTTAESLRNLRVTDLAVLPNKLQYTLSSEELFSSTIESLTVKAGTATGLGNARRKIADGAVRLNGHTVTEPNQLLKIDDLIDERFVCVRVGKSQAFFIKA